MKKNIQDLSIENTIDKSYLKKTINTKDSLNLSKTIKDIYNNLNVKKDTFHILSKKFIFDFDKVNLKKFIKYKSVILIGMGGSVLGAHSIYSFLKHKIKRNFIFIDNLDQLKIEKISSKNSLFIIISKSGNTIETLVNTNLLSSKINSRNTIIITEQKKNLLNTFAKKKNILHINHKDYIGGRYYVLS